MIGSGNIRFPFLKPTTSGLVCSLQGTRGSEGVYSVGVLASSQADHLITCVKLPACDWAAARGYTFPHIATLSLVTLEWLRNMTISLTIIDYPYEYKFSYSLQIVSFWLKVFMFYLNWNLTCSHWIIWSFYLRLIQFWSLIKSPCLLLFQYHTVLEYLQVHW